MNAFYASTAAAALLGVAGTLASGPPPQSPSAGPRYSLTLVAPPIDLDVPTFVTGINDQGRLVAYSQVNLPGPETLLFTLDGDGYRILRGLSGSVCAIGTGVNQGGHSFGFCAEEPLFDTQAVLWDSDCYAIKLETPDSHSASMAWDSASDSSVIVGEACPFPGYQRPVIWMPEKSGWRMQELDTPGWAFGQARGIDDSGEIKVGVVWNDAGTEGFMWAFDGFWAIGKLDSGTFSSLVSVNNFGEAVGSADAEGMVKALRYDQRGLVTIEPLPGDFRAEFTDINDQGIAVGFSGSDAQDRAVIAYLDQLIDLNTLLPRGSDNLLVLEQATGINEKGQIVGHGTTPFGQQIGFLLTPAY